MRPLFQQFAHPSGWLGRIAGSVMAKGTEDDRWLVDLLDLQPDDRVLEVGFGPGVAIELMSAQTRNGLIAGVDPSAVMVQEAIKRNHGAAQAARVHLRQGTVTSLPYPDSSFTKALALHSIYFWPSVEEGLRELHRVLSTGGLLAIGARMRQPDASRFNPSRYGLTIDHVADIKSTLKSVGFREVESQQRVLRREAITALLSRRS
jgi:ubiquinone/menaquinone biosynthesis C-methylase UbiE